MCDLRYALRRGGSLAAALDDDHVGIGPEPTQQEQDRRCQYQGDAGGDIAGADVPGAARVVARLNYQNIPPYYLRDRFAYGRGPQTQRLYYLAGYLQTEMTAIDDWKIRIAEATVAVPLEGPEG